MFIRKKSKTDPKNNKKYYTYQLVESVRTANGPRQKILLSIGLNKNLSHINQKMVATRIEEIIHCYHDTLVAYPKEVEELAQLLAKQLIAKKSLKTTTDLSGNLAENTVLEISENNSPEGKVKDATQPVSDQKFASDSLASLEKKSQERIFEKTSTVEDSIKNSSTSSKDFANVDLNSVVHSNCRTVGLEHITLETIRKLEIDSKLRELGFSKREIDLAIGVIVGKLVKPTSERATHIWLQNQTALPELIDCDFQKISQHRVYKISDRLISKKDSIESHLANIEDDIFSLDNTVVFFDITNTYLEGSGKKSGKAKRGRSKEKRTDCPLIALGLVINSDGFPRKSKIYEGNISEPSTLKKNLTELRDSNPAKKPIVVLDAGIASEENLRWLREKGFPYIICARNKGDPPTDLKENYDFIQEKKSNVVKASLSKIDEETGEVSLYCHSTGREEKEKAIKDSNKDKFENELKALNKGLAKKGCTKNYKKVLEKIGRLKEKYSKISRFYAIDVTKKGNSENAEKVAFKCNSESIDETYSGFYRLRSWGLDWNAERLWKTYTMLTRVEDGFRALKSDLGMRPVFHQKEGRIDGHLFITILAYHVLQSILYQLGTKGIHIRWQTLRNIMSTQTRVTSSFQDDKNNTVHVRSSTVAEPKQKEIYNALGIPANPGGYNKSVIRRKT